MTRARKLEWFATVLMVAVTITLLALALRPNRVLQQPSATDLPIAPQPVSLDGAMLEGCESSPVALIEYSDFECPECGEFARAVLPSLKAKYLPGCKVRFAFRNLPIAAIHGSAVLAAEAGACAGRQSQFWQMHALIYQEQAALDHRGLLGMAKRLRLDETAFELCMNQRITMQQIRLDAGEAVTMGVSGTPTFLIGMVDAERRVRVLRRLAGSVGLEKFVEVVDGVLLTVNTGKK